MSQKYNVAIVGATGAVGETLISILDQRNFPIENLYPLASDSSKMDIEHRLYNKSSLITPAPP